MAKQKASNYLNKQKNKTIFRIKYEISLACATYYEQNKDKIITSIPFTKINVNYADIEKYYNKDFFYFNEEEQCLNVKVSK